MKRNNDNNAKFVQMCVSLGNQGLSRGHVSIVVVKELGINTGDHGFRAWFCRLKNLRNTNGGLVWPELSNVSTKATWSTVKTKKPALKEELPLIHDEVTESL